MLVRSMGARGKSRWRQGLPSNGLGAVAHLGNRLPMLRFDRTSCDSARPILQCFSASVRCALTVLYMGDSTTRTMEPVMEKRELYKQKYEAQLRERQAKLDGM